MVMLTRTWLLKKDAATSCLHPSRLAVDEKLSVFWFLLVESASTSQQPEAHAEAKTQLSSNSVGR